MFKQALQYALKVSLATFVISLPFSFVVMMAYIRLLPLLMDNYSFNVNLDLTEAAIFASILLGCILIFTNKTEKIFGSTYNKGKITKLSLAGSVAAFTIYLLLSGQLTELDIDEYLVTYGPTFLVALIVMKTFRLKSEFT